MVKTLLTKEKYTNTLDIEQVISLFNNFDYIKVVPLYVLKNNRNNVPMIEHHYKLSVNNQSKSLVIVDYCNGTFCITISGVNTIFYYTENELVNVNTISATISDSL